jgi:hypothetical protein
MFGLRSAAVLALGFALPACDGTLDGFSSSSGQNAYSSPGYYGSSPYDRGPYAGPGYILPPPQPGYYGYEPGWGERGGRREHEWRGRREGAFGNEGHEPFNQRRQNPGNVPHMAAQPGSFAPAAGSPGPHQAPPAARPQADQNRKLINGLGFRPDR